MLTIDFYRWTYPSHELSAETVVSVMLGALEPSHSSEAAELTRAAISFNSSGRSFTPTELNNWLAAAGHHVLTARAFPRQEIVGLLICHADEEDFIADSFHICDSFIGSGIEFEMVRQFARSALANGCGAAVLTLAPSDCNPAVQGFYASLGIDLDTLPSGTKELAFAALGAEELLHEAKQRYPNNVA